jgi:hypothetical protein
MKITCTLCDWRSPWNGAQSLFHTALLTRRYGSKVRLWFDDDSGHPVCTVCTNEINEIIALLKRQHGWMKKHRNSDERREIGTWRQRYKRGKCTLAERDKAIDHVHAGSRARFYRETLYLEKSIPPEPSFLYGPEPSKRERRLCIALVLTPAPAVFHTEVISGYSFYRADLPPRQDVDHKQLTSEGREESSYGVGNAKDWTTVGGRAAAAWNEYRDHFAGWSGQGNL